MSHKNDLQKLRAQIEEYLKPPSELSGFFSPGWLPPSLSSGERPLWPLADFDLERLALLLELPARSIEESEEVRRRLAVAAKGKQLQALPPPEMALSAVREEQAHRQAHGFSMARYGRPDNRPHPQGGPGTCPAGYYHQRLDKRVNEQAPDVMDGEACPICGEEPFVDAFMEAAS